MSQDSVSNLSPSEEVIVLQYRIGQKDWHKAANEKAGSE